jgi:hypothetical protein
MLNCYKSIKPPASFDLTIAIAGFGIKNTDGNIRAA